MRTMTRCPDCLDGIRYTRCPDCNGKGEIEYASNCARCNGAGEIAHDGCPTCDSTGSVRFGRMRIVEAAKRQGGYTFPKPAATVQGLPPQDVGYGSRLAILERARWLWQIGHGSTDCALAAWASCRDEFIGRPLVVVAGARVVIPDAPARDPQHAAVVMRHGLGLILTGVSWGYGGTGPNGLAAILDDLAGAAGREIDHSHGGQDASYAVEDMHYDALLGLVARIPQTAIAWTFTFDEPAPF